MSTLCCVGQLGQFCQNSGLGQRVKASIMASATLVLFGLPHGTPGGLLGQQPLHAGLLLGAEAVASGALLLLVLRVLLGLPLACFLLGLPLPSSSRSPHGLIPRRVPRL